MTVRLHIDRLVVDPGLGIAGADGPVLREAVEAELARLLAEDRAGWSSSDAWRVQAPSISTGARDGAAALGGQIAGMLHGCLRQKQGDRMP